MFIFNNLPARAMAQGPLLQGSQEPKRDQRSPLTVLSHTALHRAKSLQCVALSLDVFIFLYCAVACTENKKGQEDQAKTNYFLTWLLNT